MDFFTDLRLLHLKVSNELKDLKEAVAIPPEQRPEGRGGVLLLRNKLSELRFMKEEVQKTVSEVRSDATFAEVVSSVYDLLQVNEQRLAETEHYLQRYSTQPIVKPIPPLHLENLLHKLSDEDIGDNVSAANTVEFTPKVKSNSPTWGLERTPTMADYGITEAMFVRLARCRELAAGGDKNVAVKPTSLQPCATNTSNDIDLMPPPSSAYKMTSLVKQDPFDFKIPLPPNIESDTYTISSVLNHSADDAANTPQPAVTSGAIYIPLSHDDLASLFSKTSLVPKPPSTVTSNSQLTIPGPPSSASHSFGMGTKNFDLLPIPSPPKLSKYSAQIFNNKFELPAPKTPEPPGLAAPVVRQILKPHNYHTDADRSKLLKRPTVCEVSATSQSSVNQAASIKLLTLDEYERSLPETQRGSVSMERINTAIQLVNDIISSKCKENGRPVVVADDLRTIFGSKTSEFLQLMTLTRRLQATRSPVGVEEFTVAV